jgi:hypothetical protein
MLAVMLIDAGFDLNQICPSPTRVPGSHEDWGDFVLLAPSLDTGVVIEVKKLRQDGKSYVADAHKDTMIRNDYDVMMAFFTLSTETSQPGPKPTPPVRQFKLGVALAS